jgi:hypothetical protein
VLRYRNAARAVKRRRPTACAATPRSGVRGFELARPALGVEEFDGVVRDIVNFSTTSANPIKRERQQLGIRVIGFLLVFF